MIQDNDGETDSMPDVTAIGLKLGFDLLTRSAPVGLEWIKTQVWGLNILVIGPGGAGKTSITDYMQLGILEDDQPHIKTQEPENHKNLQVTFGRDAALRLRVKKSTDVPGQTGPEYHADLIKSYRPTDVLIVLDGSESVKEIPPWLDPFCERFEFLLHNDNWLKKHPPRLFVALNKRDKVRRECDYKSRQKKVIGCLKNGLSEVWGVQTVRNIPVMPTSAVHSEYGTRLLDAFIRRLAKRANK